MAKTFSCINVESLSPFCEAKLVEARRDLVLPPLLQPMWLEEARAEREPPPQWTEQFRGRDCEGGRCS